MHYRKSLSERCDQKLKKSLSHTSAITVSSEQGKDNGTGMYLKTNFTYLHSKNYSPFENDQTKDIGNTSKIQGIVIALSFV